MFCPNCATPNAEGARFCRSCGADISLLPQAMTGQLQPAATPITVIEEPPGRKRGKHPNIESAIRNMFVGLGFLCVAIALAFSNAGRHWWFWMLIPAFSILGGGVAEFVRARTAQTTAHSLPAAQPAASLPRATYGNNLPPRQTGEYVAPPPSVTEGTTRHLSAEQQTRVFGTQAERPKEQ